MAPADNDLTFRTQRLTVPEPPARPRRTWLLAAAAVALVALIALALTTLGGGDDGVESGALLTRPTTETTMAGATAPADGPSPAEPPAAATTVPATAGRGPATTAAPRQRLSSSRVSLDGMGPVDIGMTLDEASVAAGTPIRIDPRTDLGRGCAFAYPQGGPEGVGFMVVDGRIARVDVRPPGVPTVSGVGIGSTENDVKETYPGRIRVEGHPYLPAGHYLVYVTNDPALRHLSMIFETDGQRVTSYRAGLSGPVSWIEGCA